MNPLLFADWKRMNRLFTKLMWAVAAVMVCVVLAVVAGAERPAHAAPAAHGAGTAVGSRPAPAATAARAGTP
jgi:hypothetical protein